MSNKNHTHTPHDLIADHEYELEALARFVDQIQNTQNSDGNNHNSNHLNHSDDIYDFTSNASLPQEINPHAKKAAIDEMLHNLNERQYQAVTSECPHSLVLAGAGSGKTKVLTTRMAYLIMSGQAKLSQMMAVTFTNKAAREMQHRLNTLLGEVSAQSYIGTFHGLCHRFLRIHYQAAQLPASFQILDTQDQQSLLKKIYKEHQISEEQYPLKNSLSFINQAKERGERVKNVQISYAGQASLLQIYQLYEQSCQNLGVLDFSELLLRCYELFTQNPQILKQYQQRFSHILIDEFQDTNALQYKWLKLFQGEQSTQKFFAVGDDDQSIYGFRGAKVGNMHDFAKNFQAQIIKLEQNYRSTATILQCANTLIRHNENRLGKELFTEQHAAQPVVIHKAFHQDLEAQKIAEHICQLLSKGVKMQEIAILYRSNAQSRVFEHVFFQQQIPYKVYGGVRFFERSEIKHAMAYLQLIDDIHNAPAFARVVNVPARGIGLKSVENLQNFANEEKLSFYQAALGLGGKFLNFTRLLDQLALQAQQKTLPELVQIVLQQTGLLDFYQQEQDDSRVDNLKELVSAAQSFSREQNYQTENSLQAIHNGEFSTTPLRHFLSFTALEGAELDDGQQGIQLMSIHASKGLEFDYVFITGLEEGLFPSYASTQANEVEEERRLMYVAITRARKGLHISLAESRMLYGSTSYNKPSRFLNELPEEATVWMPPRKQTNNHSNHNSYQQKNYNEDGGYNSYNNRQHHNGGGYQREYQREYNREDGYESSFRKNSVKDDASFSPQEKKIQSQYHQKFMKNKTVVIDEAKNQSYKIGQRVFSAKFGEGVIKNIQGQQEDAIVEIQFSRYGLKYLQLNLAKLQVIEG